MLNLSEKEKKLFNLSTVGGKSIEEAYLDVYGPKSRKILLTTIARKQKRSPALFEQINSYKRDLFEKQKADQKKAYMDASKENALTVVEKRELLRLIIARETTCEEFVVVKGEVKKVTRKPSIHEIIRAIELDSKIAGHFEAKKIQHEGGTTFLDFLKATTSKKSDYRTLAGAKLERYQQGSSVGIPTITGDNDQKTNE